ncbi:MAG TPA: hypothetical protein VKB93_27620 [Thermoanaerobaculia bacterium]|nr:hypothetical protein [Thermoanaerobaculia bacterium]
MLVVEVEAVDGQRAGERAQALDERGLAVVGLEQRFDVGESSGRSRRSSVARAS